MSDAIEKTVDLEAPVDRVWRALADHEAFGHWFGVALEAPFAVGKTVRGNITNPGYEHLTLEAEVVRMEPPRVFAFEWRPYAVDPEIDYSHETPTRVTFRLEPIPGGTRLTVTETGFDALPAHRRDEAWRMNDAGWTAQMTNIAAHVA